MSPKNVMTREGGQQSSPFCEFDLTNLPRFSSLIALSEIQHVHRFRFIAGHELWPADTKLGNPMEHKVIFLTFMAQATRKRRGQYMAAADMFSG